MINELNSSQLFSAGDRSAIEQGNAKKLFGRS
jgi:hypothetical protein